MRRARALRRRRELRGARVHPRVQRGRSAGERGEHDLGSLRTCLRKVGAQLTPCAAPAAASLAAASATRRGRDGRARNLRQGTVGVAKDPALVGLDQDVGALHRALAHQVDRLGARGEAAREDRHANAVGVHGAGAVLIGDRVNAGPRRLGGRRAGRAGWTFGRSALTAPREDDDPGSCAHRPPKILRRGAEAERLRGRAKSMNEEHRGRRGGPRVDLSSRP